MSRAISRIGRLQLIPRSRRFCQNAPAIEKAKILNEHYSSAVKWVHAAMGACVMGCVGSVLLCQSLPKGHKRKGTLMHFHKSCGLLVAGMLVPRLLLRLASRAPRHVPGPKLMQVGADLSHWVLYGMMIYMPVSGITMGYYGGKGIPFFWTHVPGASERDKNGKLAGNAYKTHKLVGQGLEYMIPLHIGGGLMHLLRGENIYPRIWMFSKQIPGL